MKITARGDSKTGGFPDSPQPEIINSVFVYGTLLTGMPNHHLVKPFIQNVQPGKTPGILYDLIYGYPAMILFPEFDQNQYVYGEVLSLRNLSEAFNILDELEDYFGPGHPDNLYDRIIRPVILESGEQTHAYLYVWRNESGLDKIGTRVMSGNWKTFKKRPSL